MRTMEENAMASMIDWNDCQMIVKIPFYKYFIISPTNIAYNKFLHAFQISFTHTISNLASTNYHHILFS